jgi:hypothetical protein
MKSYLNNHKVRGLRNNNPFNLKRSVARWQGKLNQTMDLTFEQFADLRMGIRAGLKNVITHINRGENTIRKLITTYAPPSENDTLAYINAVCSTLGIAADTKLTHIDARFLMSISRAIFKVELGNAQKDVSDDDILVAIQALGNVTTPLLTVSTETEFFF